MKRLALLLFVVMLGPAGTLFAQGGGSQQARAAYYDMTETGEVAIRVHVWGAVSNAGLYRIVRGTDLKELLSMAGGPDLGTRTRRSKQTLILKVIRTGTEGQQVIFDQTMEDEILVFEDAVILQSGDIVAVEQISRRQIGYFDIIPLVSAAASLALLLERVLN